MGLTTKEIGSSSFNDMISSVDRRSEYVENRANANVTLNNLLTPYTLDNKSSILNAPCGYSNGVYASLRPIKTFGPELVTNGDFATDSDWNKGTGWSIANGTANCDGTQTGNSNLYQPITFEVGKIYQVSFEVSNYTTGTIKTVFGDTGGTLRSSNGLYVENFTFVSGSNFYLQGNSSFIGSIDNVSVKEVTDADFDFSRGSSATRVNEQGLIEDVQILSGNLVQNGNFEEIGSELVTNGNFEEIGSELVTNGNFDTDSDWVKSPSGLTISGGSANFTSGQDTYVFQDIMTIGKQYFIELEYNISSLTTGYFGSNGGSGNAIISMAGLSGSGTLSGYITASSARLIIRSSSFDGSIDNVSVKEVGQNWNFGTGWSIANGQANCDGVGINSLQQSGITTTGKIYKLTFDVISKSNDDFLIISTNFGDTYVSGSSANLGTNTFYIKPTNGTGIRFRVANGTTLSIDNVSVKEVGQNWTFETGWSMGDGKVIAAGTMTANDNLIQNYNFTDGNKYRFSFTISDYQSGGVFIRQPFNGGAAGDIVNSNGTYTFDYIAGANNELMFRSDNGFTGSIDNVSVIEITDDTDIPRIDYTDGTGALLLEPQSTNLITYSEDLTQWSASSGIQLTSGQLGVGNSNDAWKIQRSLAYDNIRSIISFTSTSTVSVYAKKGSYNFLRIAISSITEQCYFDLENGIIGTTSNLISSDIKYINNGWYRCSMTFNNSSGTGVYIQPVETDGGIGNSGTGHIFVQYPQTEALSFKTSYIPTEGLTVTRLADVANNSGNADLINSTEGVLYAEILKKQDNNDSYILISLNNDASNADDDSVTLGFDASDDFYFRVKSNDSDVLISDNITSNKNQFYKVAVKYKSGDCAVWIDGVEQVTSTNSFTFGQTLDNLSFDFNGNERLPFYGNVKSLAVFKEALTDDELAQITSATQQEVFYEMRNRMNIKNYDYYEFGDYTTRLKKLF